ncbi:MAG: peptide ABC transporter substrate-binding protein [Oscillospiraceae bacterium]|nr:peptide ABC transporter substrate-binding protein [Oscillospiraceae bacterium]
MLKKIISVFMVLCIVILCFSACSDKDTANKAFACAVTEMPVHFDPQIASTVGEKMIAVNIFDGLFKPDENGTLQNCVVKDYSVSDDGLVYTFKLFDNMSYYISEKAKKFIKERGGNIDGKITADDFVFGLTRAVLPETAAPDFELISAIKNAEAVHSGQADSSALGVRATGEYTLEITLERADINFIYALSQPVSYPCDREFFELTAGRYGLEEKYIITNGAFYLSSVTADTSVRIVKNSEYNGQFAAVPASVSFYRNTDITDAAKKVDKGTYDCGFFATSESLDKLGRSVSVKELPNISQSLIFNMSNKNMQNLSLRTGLVSCIDLSAVTDTPVDALIPPYYGLVGERMDIPVQDKIPYDIENARTNMVQAFKELGIDSLTVEILCTEDYEDTVKAIVNCWQRDIGVELNGTVTVLDKEDFEKRIASADFDMAVYPLTADSNNAVSFLSLFTEGNANNVVHHSSEEYDRLVSELRKLSDVQNAAYCQSYLLKNAVVLPLFTENTAFAVADGVSGIYFYGDSANVYFYKGQK